MADLIINRLLQRPIFGGVFGRGQYTLATVPCVSRGLHAVRFMVIEPQAGAVISVAEDKTDALASARRVIKANQAILEVEEADLPVQAHLWPSDPVGALANPMSARPPSRRKTLIFQKSGGKCHYCAVPLQLDGKWHIEHMMPRALGGSDDSANLVASCVKCNLDKRDRTAIEFVADFAK